MIPFTLPAVRVMKRKDSSFPFPQKTPKQQALAGLLFFCTAGMESCSGCQVQERRKHANRLLLISFVHFYSITCPSVVMVTTLHGIHLPLACSAFLTACSMPPQQGTSMRTTVTL